MDLQADKSLKQEMSLEQEIEQWETDPASKVKEITDRVSKSLNAVKPRCSDPTDRSSCPLADGRICMHKNLWDRHKYLTGASIKEQKSKTLETLYARLIQLEADQEKT